MPRLVLALAFLTACAPGALIDRSTTLDRPDGQAARSLADHIAIDALTGHLGHLEAIADAADSTRVSTSEGYERSIAYVVETLTAAGYDVALDPYQVTNWDLAGATLEVEGSDLGFDVLLYSGGGTVSGTPVAVDVQLPPGQANDSTSGCEASDFSDFPSGSIALIQRGSCTFAAKVANAEAAGALAVVIFNEGQSGRREVVEGVLDEQSPASIPVLGVEFATGEAWAMAPVAIEIVVDASYTVTTEHNIITELAGKAPDHILMVGAHLDSVAEGPGINDNGSGTALVLEAALQLAQLEQPERTVRFAWWGAEEQGLVGSWHYVHDENSGEADLARMAHVDAYLNFDMLASGNGLAFVSDGDGSDIQDGGASAGSAQIEDIFEDYFASLDRPTEPEGLYISSDSWWFVDLGIPTGHIFSGAFGVKTEDEAARFGGTAGRGYDPCYHQLCDDVARIDPVLYEHLAKAAAHAIGELAWTLDDLGSQNERGLRRTDRPRPHGCHEHVRWDR